MACRKKREILNDINQEQASYAKLMFEIGLLNLQTITPQYCLQNNLPDADTGTIAIIDKSKEIQKAEMRIKILKSELSLAED
jgi:hypothetical protein